MSGEIKLETAAEIIDALGGTGKVAERFGVSIEVVCMWRKNGFPARRFLQWQRVLAAEGKTAPPSLWGQK